MNTPCPVPGCADHAEPGKLMCLTHWRLVPHEVQMRVWQTWRVLRYQHSASRRAAMDEYRLAKEEAIEAAFARCKADSVLL